jgi:hypothetical protein
MHALTPCLFVVLIAAGAETGKPDFTGTWKLNLEKSTVEATPEVTLTIRHAEPEFVAIQEAGGEKIEFKLAIDGKEHKTTLPDGNEATAVLRWDGNAILSELTIPTGGGTLIFKDRITLADGGKQMLFQRKMVGPDGGQQDQGLVWDKQ